MNVEDVKARLTGRWPDDRWLHVYEAPTRHDRQGGAIDVLLLGLWQSDGHEIDAIEVKVSYSDWTKEWRQVGWHITDHNGVLHQYSTKPRDYQLDYYTGVDARSERRYAHAAYVPDDFVPTVERVVTINTSKSIDWRQRAHRFWVAAPAKLATKIKLDVESITELAGWGVLAVDDNGQTRILVKPAKQNNPTPLTNKQWLGIVRAAANSGFQALQRAEHRGENAGYKRGKADAERQAQRHRDARPAQQAMFNGVAS